MTLAAAKQKLHDYIEHADSKKVKAILTLLENDAGPEYEFTDADMKELDRRWDNYVSGKSKSYTLDEAMKNIKLHRENRKKNGL